MNPTVFNIRIHVERGYQIPIDYSSISLKRLVITCTFGTNFHTCMNNTEHLQ